MIQLNNGQTFRALVDECYFALNALPRQRIPDGDGGDTYKLASKIGAALKAADNALTLNPNDGGGAAMKMEALASELDLHGMQIGVSEEVNFEANTWAFKMPGGFKASAGKYMIVKVVSTMPTINSN